MQVDRQAGTGGCKANKHDGEKQQSGIKENSGLMGYEVQMGNVKVGSISVSSVWPHKKGTW